MRLLLQKLLLAVAAAPVIVLSFSAVPLDDRPWVGILGLPAAVECASLQRPGSIGFDASGSCFSNVYDKWAQAGGSRVVGIPHDALDTNRSALDELLSSVNGVIFTGGGLNLSDASSYYYRTGKYIFEWVQRTNDAGTYYPLTGHCMGFQYLAVLAAQDNSSVLLLDHFDSEDLSMPLHWAANASSSRWLRRMPRTVKQTFADEDVTTNLHHDGVSPATFACSPPLLAFFNIISTNFDRGGREFISTMEAKRYPILAMQWHPERNQFEWSSKLGINHSVHAIAANAWTAVDFVNEARRNRPKRRNWDLLRKLSTYSMEFVQVGDPLDGLQYLMYGGFEIVQTRDFETSVVVA